MGHFACAVVIQKDQTALQLNLLPKDLFMLLSVFFVYVVLTIGS